MLGQAFHYELEDKNDIFPKKTKIIFKMATTVIF